MAIRKPYDNIRADIKKLEHVLDGLYSRLETERKMEWDDAYHTGDEERMMQLEAGYSSPEEEQPLKSKKSRKSKTGSPLDATSDALDLDEYKRYGRQMLLPQIGLPGQKQLKAARVLIVGLGGLGCPAAMYLAGAGVGTIALQDGDKVEESNLHRQVLHRDLNVGKYKSFSACEQLRELNPHVKVIPIPSHLQAEHSVDEIKKSYDLILDCTDRPSTRYMISDLAVLAGKPLVSASALKTEGQLLVLNNPPCKHNSEDESKGFCYRCVFPKPPAPEAIQSCGEGGILGPVVGVMGVLMATEAIKILTTPESSELQESSKRMLLYSAYSDPQFRTIKLLGKRKGCPSCSCDSTITAGSISSWDYEVLCGTTTTTTPPPRNGKTVTITTIKPRDLAKLIRRGTPKVTLLDVRSPTEFGICSLQNAQNLPLINIQRDPSVLRKHLVQDTRNNAIQPPHLVFVCRYGNDSRVAVRKAMEYCKGFPEYQELKILDLVGGLKRWKEDVDPEFPEY